MLIFKNFRKCSKDIFIDSKISYLSLHEESYYTDVTVIYGWRLSQPEQSKITQSRQKSHKNHREAVRSRKSQLEPSRASQEPIEI